jgi:hypothetical protein
MIEVLKKLLIPVFAVAVATVGCSGGSTNATGDGKTGAVGSTAGADAATADAAGSTASADGSMTGLNSPPAGADAGCTLETFCPIFLQYCGTANPGYTTLEECMTTYAAVGASNPSGQQCESYHLCNAIDDTGSDRALHCSHAAGRGGVCVPAPF